MREDPGWFLPQIGLHYVVFPPVLGGTRNHFIQVIRHVKWKSPSSSGGGISLLSTGFLRYRQLQPQDLFWWWGVLLLCDIGCSFGVEARDGFLCVNFLRDNTFFHSPSRGWSVAVTAAVLGVLGLGGVFPWTPRTQKGSSTLLRCVSVVVGSVGIAILDWSAIWMKFLKICKLGNRQI